MPAKGIAVLRYLPADGTGSFRASGISLAKLSLPGSNYFVRKSNGFHFGPSRGSSQPSTWHAELLLERQSRNQCQPTPSFRGILTRGRESPFFRGAWVESKSVVTSWAWPADIY